jgi:ABC-type multidrug transport system ATPase subunit
MVEQDSMYAVASAADPARNRAADFDARVAFSGEVRRWVLHCCAPADTVGGVCLLSERASVTGVSLDRVSKNFGPVRALIAVSAEFPVGSFTFVRGANGSGKSTLLSLLGTLTTPTTGRILHGCFGARPPQIRSTLGWLGHETLMYGDLSGRQNLVLAAELYALDPVSVVRDAVQRFSLESFLERPVRTYSRGQRQRIALARALCHTPSLLLLDEPTTGLDTAGTIELVAVLTREQVNGTTIVVVTHDVDFGARAGTRTLVLERGRVLAS